MSLEDKIKSTVRNVPDFPKPGINFKDISTILEDPALSKEILEEFRVQLKDQKIDLFQRSFCSQVNVILI